VAGSRGRAVAGIIVSLRGDFAYQLRAEILELVGKFVPRRLSQAQRAHLPFRFTQTRDARALYGKRVACLPFVQFGQRGITNFHSLVPGIIVPNCLFQGRKRIFDLLGDFRNRKFHSLNFISSHFSLPLHSVGIGGIARPRRNAHYFAPPIDPDEGHNLQCYGHHFCATKNRRG
jgi:hypothetical protein